MFRSVVFLLMLVCLVSCQRVHQTTKKYYIHRDCYEATFIPWGISPDNQKIYMMTFIASEGKNHHAVKKNILVVQHTRRETDNDYKYVELVPVIGWPEEMYHSNGHYIVYQANFVVSNRFSLNFLNTNKRSN